MQDSTESKEPDVFASQVAPNDSIYGTGFAIDSVVSQADSVVIVRADTLAEQKANIEMFSISDIFVIVLLLFLLVERFFFNKTSSGNRQDTREVRKEISMMKNEFSKLSTVIGAFLMNVEFKRQGDKIVAESRLKDTDTQVMVSSKEMDRLRGMEQSLHDHAERLIVSKNETTRKQDKKRDDWKEDFGEDG